MSAALLAGRLASAGIRAPVSRSRVVRVQAVNTRLAKPQRLWEIGSETWVPGTTPPSYLDGSLPGDRSFDPLRLGEKITFNGKPGDGLAWVLEGELYNGRVAMLAVLGVLGGEILGKGPWYENVTNWNLPYWPLVVGIHLIWSTLEWTRYTNFKTKGETGLGPFVPFDPLNLVDDYKRQSEIRNGRLAMLANLGFWAQYLVTKKSPLQNLADHLANPAGNNILSTAAGQKVAIDVAVVGAVLYGLEAYQNSAKEAKTA